MITIIDGNNYLHRAYHVHRHLQTSSGLPTGGIFGFLQYIYKFFDSRKDNEYFMIAWDSYAKRKKDHDSDYKANRLQSPISSQQKALLELISYLGIQQFRVKGEEADDVISTLAHEARKSRHKVTILSSDHDFDQLISKHVQIIAPLGKNKYRYKDLEYVKDKYQGLSGWQLGEVMKIMGDSGDNVKGVKGIAEKTACRLIRANGSVRKILANIQNAKMYNGKNVMVPITKRLASLIEQYRERLYINDELVVLKKDLPIDFTIKEALDPKWDDFMLALKTMECNSIIKKIDNWTRVIKYEPVI